MPRKFPFYKWDTSQCAMLYKCAMELCITFLFLLDVPNLLHAFVKESFEIQKWLIWNPTKWEISFWCAFTFPVSQMRGFKLYVHRLLNSMHDIIFTLVIPYRRIFGYLCGSSICITDYKFGWNSIYHPNLIKSHGLTTLISCNHFHK